MKKSLETLALSSERQHFAPKGVERRDNLCHELVPRAGDRRPTESNAHDRFVLAHRKQVIKSTIKIHICKRRAERAVKVRASERRVSRRISRARIEILSLGGQQRTNTPCSCENYIFICIPCHRCSLLYKHTHTKRNAMQITPIGTSIHGRCCC